MKNPFLVYQAKSFYNAYIALEQLKAEEDELLYLVPRLVNGAFSAELIIKAILIEQNIPYSNEHNLKILFDKLPADIQNRIWEFLTLKAPEYSDITKCETELLIMSDAFVQWRYCFEGSPPAFDSRFLSAFTNALIFVMFDLGYNVFFSKLNNAFTQEKYADIDKMFEDNRKNFITVNQEKIQKKRGTK